MKSFFFSSENINNRWVKPMKDALLEKENCNVILVDWSKGASNLLNYLQAAGNTRLVGRQISVLIKFLISYGNNGPGSADRFYIVGFSLGAHTAGYAGSYLKARYNLTLDRITGKFTPRDDSALELRGHSDFTLQNGYKVLVIFCLFYSCIICIS